MKSKINFLVLILLFSPIPILAQSKFLPGKWSFRSLMENGENISLPASSKDHYLEFTKDGTFSSSITCNSIGGNYLLGTKGKIKFNSLRITAMACLDEKLKIENSLGNILKKIGKYQIKGNGLTLQDERGINVVTLTKYNELKQNIQGEQIK